MDRKKKTIIVGRIGLLAAAASMQVSLPRIIPITPTKEVYVTKNGKRIVKYKY